MRAMRGAIALLVAVAGAGKPVNLKKGQFLSPEEIKAATEAIARPSA